MAAFVGSNEHRSEVLYIRARGKCMLQFSVTFCHFLLFVAVRYQLPVYPSASVGILPLLVKTGLRVWRADLDEISKGFLLE